MRNESSTSQDRKVQVSECFLSTLCPKQMALAKWEVIVGCGLLSLLL